MHKKFEDCKDQIVMDPSDIRMEKEVRRLFPLIHAIKREVLRMSIDGEFPSFLEIKPGAGIVTKILRKSYPIAKLNILDDDNQITAAYRAAFSWMGVHHDDIIPRHEAHRADIIHHNWLVHSVTPVRAMEILKSHMGRCKVLALQVPVLGYNISDKGLQLWSYQEWLDFMFNAQPDLRCTDFGVMGLGSPSLEAYFVCRL